MSNRIKTLSLCFSIMFLICPFSQAQKVCPDWLIEKGREIPKCPPGGLVPETYPVGAVVVSDMGMAGQDANFTADVVEKVLMASKDKNPLLVLPVSDSTISRVKSKIDALPITEKLKAQYKRSILQVPTRSYTWQQDYMQAFANPENGQVVLKEIKDYGRHGDSFYRLLNSVKECGFTAGPRLENDGIVSGHYGGNIETLPFGICLLGDDHFKNESEWKKYADQICNSGDENRIKVPTSWLRVGHTDEIVKLIPNKNAAHPCDYSITIASPRKAIELLKSTPDDVFLNVSDGRGESARDLAIRRSNEYYGLRTLCRKNIESRDLRKPMRRDGDRSKGMSHFLNFSISTMSEAKASDFVVRGPEDGEVEDCANMTNRDIYHLLTSDTELKIYNQLIQEKMDALKEDIRKKLKYKNSTCEVDIIEVPGIFFGGAPVEVQNDKYELPLEMGVSILPNPTNAITVNDTVIAPATSNTAFNSYIKSEYEKRGLKFESVDTFDYAHQGMGNLHCSTNTIHICNPRGK